VIANTVR